MATLGEHCNGSQDELTEAKIVSEVTFGSEPLCQTRHWRDRTQSSGICKSLAMIRSRRVEKQCTCWLQRTNSQYSVIR